MILHNVAFERWNGNLPRVQLGPSVGSRSAPIFRIPHAVLSPAAALAQSLLGANSPLHPVRVKKAAMSTHILPGVLQKMGFEFRYPFLKSLEHLRSIAPQDFEA